MALTRGGTSLTVDVPPKVLDRAVEGGPDRAAAIGLTGAPIVVEWPAPSHAAHLRLRWEQLSGAQVTTLNTLLDGVGPVTVRLYTGGSTVSCMFGPRSEQKIVPLLGEYPEKLADGSAQLAERTQCSAELVLYRI